MKLSKDKYNTLSFEANNKGVTVNIWITEVSGSESQKLLGVVIDSKLNFSHYINQFCIESK